MNRKVIIGVVAAVVVIGVLGWVLLSGGNNVTEAAEEFLTLVSTGKGAEAYDSIDLTLQARLDKDKFLQAIKEQKMTLYQSVSWSSQEVAEEEADLAGTMTLKDGSTAGIVLTLLLTEEQWRVSDLHLNNTTRKVLGFQAVEEEIPLLKAPEPANRDQVPSKAGLRFLSTETIMKLDEAIKSQDFSDFYNNYISREYRKVVDAKQLHDIFYAFYENKIDLSEVKNFTPIFDNVPSIDDKGYFVFAGRYPTYPVTVFQIVYVFEDGMWKVFHIRVTR